MSQRIAENVEGTAIFAAAAAGSLGAGERDWAVLRRLGRIFFVRATAASYGVDLRTAVGNHLESNPACSMDDLLLLVISWVAKHAGREV